MIKLPTTMAIKCEANHPRSCDFLVGTLNPTVNHFFGQYRLANSSC